MNGRLLLRVDLYGSPEDEYEVKNLAEFAVLRGAIKGMIIDFVEAELGKKTRSVKSSPEIIIDISTKI